MLDAVNHLLSYRAIESYVASPTWLDGHAGMNAPRGSAMPGNLATCALITKKGVHSNSLFAPSHSVKNDVREHQRRAAMKGSAIGSSIASLIDGEHLGGATQCWVTGPQFDSEAVLYPMAIRPKKGKRQADSECIILNVVDGMIEIGEIEDLTLVVLTSERIPCGSCTQVIIKFLRKHASVKLIVQFRHNSGHILKGRGFSQFRTEVTSAGLQSRVAAMLAVGLEGAALQTVDLNL